MIIARREDSITKDELIKEIDEHREQVQHDLDCFLDGIQEQLNTDVNIIAEVCNIVLNHMNPIRDKIVNLDLTN